MTNKQETDIRKQLDRWFAAWSPGRKGFDVEALRPLFFAGEIHVVDDFGDRVVTIASFDDYAATWGPVMAGFADWAIRPAGRPDVQVSGDLAAVTFAFIGEGHSHASEAVKIAQHGTQVWRRLEDDWVIVHEHLTSDKPENLEA